MKRRTWVALGLLLLAGSRSSAQQHVEEPVGPPRAVTPAVQASPFDPKASPFEPHCIDCEPQPASGGRFWIGSDIFVGYMGGTRLPPLVTTSTLNTAKPRAGILGEQSTTVLFGGLVNQDDPRMGFHLATGYWFDCERRCGVEAGFMVMESQATFFNATSSTATLPILARPYFDANTETNQAVLIAFPGTSTGSVEVRARSGNFYEGHLDFTENFVNRCGFRLDSILGYRFYRYDESVTIRQSISPTDPNFVPGTQIVSEDDFSARNDFHGCDIGLRAEWCCHAFTVGLLGKVAAGVINHDVNIQGSQSTTVPGLNPVVNNGGVLALSSNIGKHPSYDWGVLPEFGINLSWQVNCNVRLYSGYSILWMNQMAHAADHIDQTVNPNLFPPPIAPLAGPDRPAFTLSLSEMWLETFNFGVEIRF